MRGGEGEGERGGLADLVDFGLAVDTGLVDGEVESWG